jgi:hypothetical protein
MSKGLRKAMVSNNPKVRAIMVSISGTVATPLASGLDASQIDSVVDNGAGDYTIILKYPYNANSSALPHVQATSITDAIKCTVSAVAYDRVTIKCTDGADAATDADINIMMVGNDNRLTY